MLIPALNEEGSIGAVIQDGRTGVLVPERDVRALAAAIGTLLRDPARRAAIGQAGRRQAETQFGWDATAGRLEAAYDRALAFKSLTR